ncbi:exosortase F-associated protein [Gillisia sp. Hel_I_86]|uniref:exosortase F system-associated membrane protein n=1 Tax=Gillisia sp. Hel_I_86 TaxID=1249981 RepID=UPI00119C8956|nr:exosortase F system-associated protein [Gillisia sp. Hel_I_86]TVZ26837.1 exosortase F-associated protein [Gillisia sp. Hel_I_86]
MKKRFKVLLISFFVILLALVRYFENELFYDPLIKFYEADYLRHTVPNFETGRLFFNVLLRYALNSTLSLGILYVTFFDKNIFEFSVYLFSIFFVTWFLAFVFLIFEIENQHFLALFYVRRFLIHPILVLVLMPAFYYYRRKNAHKFKS